MINVKHKTCLECKKIPVFNIDGQKALYCADHKKPDMIDVKHKTCLECKKRPNFNIDGQKALYCADHKKPDMIDVKSKRCLGQDGLCPVSANSKYDNYCTFCFAHTFPTDPRTKDIHINSKELTVRNHINTNFKGFIHNTPIWTGGCDCTHRRRIDHRRLINNTLICVETDEHQHLNYDKKDEVDRMNDLFMAYGGKFIFIRFNPDKYKEHGRTKNPSLGSRLNTLTDTINKQIQRVLACENDELIEVVYLYYDKK
jgi:hypothetical protein